MRIAHFRTAVQNDRADTPWRRAQLATCRRLVEHAATFSPSATAVGASIVLLIVVWNRMMPQVPGYIVALVAGTVENADTRARLVAPRDCLRPGETWRGRA